MDQRKLEVVNAPLVGTASVNWGYDPLYTWVQVPSFAHMLDQMAIAGYAGTEVSGNFPSDVVEVQEALGQRGLRAAATFHAVDLRRATVEEALPTVRELAQRLVALGSNSIIFSDKPSPERLRIAGRAEANGSPHLSDSQWRALCEGLNRLGESVAALGLRAVFHPHAGTYVETREEIDRLCALTDPMLIGLCPDTGHLAYSGVSPEAIFNDYASRIAYVHLKDVDAQKLERVRKAGLDFVSAVRMGLFVELGTGMVRLDEIITSLQRNAYSGWLIVEQDAPAEPDAAALRNREYLRRKFGL